MVTGRIGKEFGSRWVAYHVDAIFFVHGGVRLPRTKSRGYFTS